MVISKVYMYVSGKTGNLRSFYGDVYVPQNILSTYFVSNNGVKTKCSCDEGVASNNCIWYHSPNPEKAIHKLMDYEEKFIKKYQIRVEKHKEKYRLLQNALDQMP